MRTKSEIQEDIDFARTKRLVVLECIQEETDKDNLESHYNQLRRIVDNLNQLDIELHNI